MVIKKAGLTGFFYSVIFGDSGFYNRQIYRRIVELSNR